MTSNLKLKDKRGEPICNPASAYPIRLSTAIDNSTRFPFIEPAGGLPVITADCKDVTQMDYIVDGGYYDNYGASTLLDMIRDLNMGVYQLFVIQITNDLEIFERLDPDKAAVTAPDCVPLDNSELPSSSGDLGNLYKAAMAARSWTGLEYAEQLRDRIRQLGTDHPSTAQWFHIGIRCVSAPLGWELSGATREHLDTLVNTDARVKNESDKLLSALKSGL